MLLPVENRMSQANYLEVCGGLQDWRTLPSMAAPDRDPLRSMACQSQLQVGTAPDGPRKTFARALASLAEIEFRMGDWQAAYASAVESLRLAHVTGRSDEMIQALTSLALVEAGMGRPEACRRHGQHALALAGHHSDDSYVAAALGALALLELGLGRFDACIAWLERLGPGTCPAVTWITDLVEALIRRGEGDRAAETLAAVATGLPEKRWSPGRQPLERCRGLLAADDEFEAHFARALDGSEHPDEPFQRARTLLCLGQRLRNVGRRGAARERLRSALDTFERLGAEPWADSARRELDANGAPAPAAALSPAGPRNPAGMEFRILGPLEILDEGKRIALPGKKQRALLALLLVHSGETLGTDRLIDELWGERPPTTAAKTVHVHVSRLRKALAAAGGGGADAVVLTREHGYELAVPPERIDAHRFERLVAEGRSGLVAGRVGHAAAVLEEALSLWRGRPLDDLAYEPFAQPEIARLDGLRVEALEHLVDAKLALGRHVEVVGELEALIADHPYREGLRAQLILALYRCDRQAEALQAYQDARRTLVEELGIEPGERLRQLERAVLAQDPALAVPAPPPVAGDGEREPGDASPPGSARSALPTGVITFLMTDIEGSSSLWELDAGVMAAALELHDDLIADTVIAHGGRLLKAKGEGDATLSVFRRASDAAACAMQLQTALLGASWPGALDLRVRIAVHTGEAYERGGDYFGPTLNRAARLRGLARGGATLLSHATAQVVLDCLPADVELIDLGWHDLRGLTRPENVFELRAIPETLTHEAGGNARPATLTPASDLMGVLPAPSTAGLPEPLTNDRESEHSAIARLRSGRDVTRPRLPRPARPVPHGDGLVVARRAGRTVGARGAAVDLPVGVLGDTAAAHRVVAVDDAHEHDDADDHDLHGREHLALAKREV
jgi:DNA-binding SARP family transcriptional activator